jgi:branched-subunit amino acid transport protein
MPWSDFLLILAVTVGCMLASRTLPVLLFSNREIPGELDAALRFIPVAAFAALVANDLFNPEALAAAPATALLPLLASVPVVIVALKSKSLWLCIVTGVATLACLQLLLPLSWLAG